MIRLPFDYLAKLIVFTNLFPWTHQNHLCCYCPTYWDTHKADNKRAKTWKNRLLLQHILTTYPVLSEYPLTCRDRALT